ncbi:UNVERIFIED_CONTAM: hypothetical protein K2H54_066999 [Gekko kuhli]
MVVGSASAVTTEDLMSVLSNLETTFLDNISSLMKPFYEHLDIILENLTEMKNVVDTAMNNSLANQLDIQQMLMMEDLLAEETMRLDMSLRQKNLKLRGLEEKRELLVQLPNWLGKENPTEGFKLLRSLDIDIPVNQSKRSHKRRLFFLATSVGAETNKSGNSMRPLYS